MIGLFTQLIGIDFSNSAQKENCSGNRKHIQERALVHLQIDVSKNTASVVI